jgi:ribonuclease P protein component
VIQTPPLSASGAQFPRAARVRTRAEFTQVFDGARRIAHPQLSLHWLDDGRPARLGLAVSRKVDPHAVGRNRIKRALREAFRRVRTQLAPGAYVVVARPAARDVPGVALRTVFLGVLQRAGALPPSVTPGTMPAGRGPTTPSPVLPPSTSRPGAG